VITFDNYSGTIGNRIWNNGTPSPYKNLVYQILEQLEGVETELYLDTAEAQNPTIGIGFNLTDRTTVIKPLYF
jgi:hypothetical protein